MKKILTLVLALFTLFALASCGPKEEKKPEKVALENVYMAKKLPTPDGVDLYNIMMSGDRAFFNGSKEVKTTDDDGNEISDWYDCVYTANADLTDIRELYTFKGEWNYDETTGTDTGKYLNGYNAGANGKLWLSFTEYKSWYDSDTEQYNYEENTVLKLLEEDGSFSREISITPLLKSRPEFAGDSYSTYMGQLAETSDGKLVMLIGNKYIFVIDKDANPLSLTELPQNKSPNDVALINDDTLRLSAWDWSGEESKVEIIDFSISKAEFKTIDTISSYHSVQMADDGTVYINDYSTISRYDFDKKEEVPLLDFINSDINSDRLSSFYPAGNDEFYTFEYDADWEGRQLLHLTPAAKGEVVEKYIITLAANALDSQLKSMIIDYNRSSKDYRIAVKVYGWEEADTERFDLDLLSGATPDIVCIDSSLSLTKYATKGIFADLGAYLDSDDEINRDTLLPNVLKACETNGKIYSLPVNFAVRSLVTKKSLVGDKTSLTFDDVKSILSVYPGAVFMRETDREQLMTGFLPVILEEYIDYKNGKSNFSDGTFKSFLEFAKAFPAKIDYDTYYNDIDWEAYENDFKENRVIANSVYLSSFNSIEWQEEQFGEEIVCIGYPTNKGEPHALNLNTQFAIGAKSVYKEQAWDFMKMLLAKEYQTEYTWTFPINKEAFEEMKEKEITSTKSRYEKEAMEDDEYFDDDFIMDDDMVVMPREEVAEVVVETSEELVASDKVVTLPETPIAPVEDEEFTSEKLERMLGYIDSIYNIATTTTRLARYNDPVLDIITSDVGAYFDSKKSAEETCKTIESRVNLYLAENS
ncbi:MAG: extracellular solute-binding protein [Clostridia bacterium]|nr:extracellular solute-binding protein [Clostridia bacterium]MBQ7897762.1 extracellular solute-binding protein [Clostridia bacterium]